MMEIERRREEAEAHIRATIMNEFCHIMNRSGLPPMAIMRYAAQAIGAVYREIADTHSGPNPCPCNWHPNEKRDIEVLCTALMAAIHFKPGQNLSAMRPAGSA
jgi:hypothetical protein